jgi:hypothetical protein
MRPIGARCRRPTDLKMREAAIRPRIRKLIGTVALLSLVVVWSLFAMALAQIVLVRANGLLDFAYYLVAGLGWVLPAMPLISWMSRGDGPGRNSSARAAPDCALHARRILGRR